MIRDIKIMHKTEYIEYLKSEDWKIRRKELMELAIYICEKCGGEATVLHHLNYDNLGNEQLGTDVIAVCQDCHKQIHGIGEYGYQEHTAYC